MEKSLCIIAGRGVYPLELARSARANGVQRVHAVAFRGETRKDLAAEVDGLRWVRVGRLADLLDAVKSSGAPEAVMVGQIKPAHLFLARFDAPMRELLARLPRRNADTIFGAVGEELAKLGVTLVHAGRFMESRMPAPGVLTNREPTEREWADIRQGFDLAKFSASHKAGQSVVVKNGTVLAVEAFEGTDKMILRAGRVGGRGGVVVKVAQEDHDMRFDIPAAGPRTLQSMKRAGCGCLALEAHRSILLERDKVIFEANAANICVVAVEAP